MRNLTIEGACGETFLFQTPLFVTVIIAGIVPTDQLQGLPIPKHYAIILRRRVVQNNAFQTDWCFLPFPALASCINRPFPTDYPPAVFVSQSLLQNLYRKFRISKQFFVIPPEMFNAVAGIAGSKSNRQFNFAGCCQQFSFIGACTAVWTIGGVLIAGRVTNSICFCIKQTVDCVLNRQPDKLVPVIPQSLFRRFLSLRRLPFRFFLHYIFHELVFLC